MTAFWRIFGSVEDLKLDKKLGVAQMVLLSPAIQSPDEPDSVGAVAGQLDEGAWVLAVVSGPRSVELIDGLEEDMTLAAFHRMVKFCMARSKEWLKVL